MKVAIVTMDGKTVSQHFGRSPYFKILTIEKNEITHEELRERHFGHFAQQKTENHAQHEKNEKHGYGAEADAKHASMVTEISDCQILVAGGMGQGAYESFSRAKLNVYLTDKSDIQDVANALIQNNLQNLASSRTD